VRDSAVLIGLLTFYHGLVALGVSAPRRQIAAA
jgi:hypothetical protein